MTGLACPKVSVCIPVYNGEAYIAESIESVLGQTYEDFRLIICDNCSTDNTPDVVRGFRDSRITYLRNSKNLGLVGNANRCLTLADGEYVCILHHDDAILPKNLERKVHVLDKNPEVGFVHSNVFVTDAEGQIVSEWNEDSRRDYIEDGRKVFHRYITRMHLGALIFIGAVLARRACYDRLGGYRPELHYADDSEMWMRMSLFYDVACIGTPLVKWRQHSTNKSIELGLGVQWLEEHFLATRIIFQEYQERIPGWKNLKKEVDEGFIREALRKGLRACGNDDFETAGKYLRWARKVSRGFSMKKDYWKLNLRLAVGPKGDRLCRSMKGKLREAYGKLHG